MIRTITLLALLLVLAAPVAPVQAQETEEGGQSLFINLTSNEVNRSHMAIMLGRRVMAEKKIPVTIWLNVEGVRLVDRTLAQPRSGDGMTGLEELEAFMKEGGTVMVCPMCLKNVGGMTKEDLPAGIIMSEMDAFWSKAFADDVTVLSY